MKQQLKEAILAGERALRSLDDAGETLESAEGWGLFDLLGGGFIATAVKRSKMKEAKAQLEDARRDLLAFQRELRDVQLYTDLDLDADGFLSFADYFFDDFFSDLLVQRKINQAQAQIEQAQRQISSIVAALRQKYGSM